MDRFAAADLLREVTNGRLGSIGGSPPSSNSGLRSPS
jgi:hypothetical protein